jgi:hypothetical protein
MGKTKNTTCPVKTQGLDLKPAGPGRWIDQHGRILEIYSNKDGKQDLRPVGVGYPR